MSKFLREDLPPIVVLVVGICAAVVLVLQTGGERVLELIPTYAGLLVAIVGLIVAKHSQTQAETAARMDKLRAKRSDYYACLDEFRAAKNHVLEAEQIIESVDRQLRADNDLDYNGTYNLIRSAITLYHGATAEVQLYDRLQYVRDHCSPVAGLVDEWEAHWQVDGPRSALFRVNGLMFQTVVRQRPEDLVQLWDSEMDQAVRWIVDPPMPWGDECPPDVISAIRKELRQVSKGL